MSFMNFPLMFLFGGRNNILIWATGWSFATFNVFHRHVARVATLQAVVHSILYGVIYFLGKWRHLPAHGPYCSTECQKHMGAAHKFWKGMSKVYVLWGVLVSFSQSQHGDWLLVPGY